MAITYATSGFTFVESQGGSASANNIKSLVLVPIDRKFHKQVQNKVFFRQKGLIGDDAYSEGTVSETVSGLPIIRKTDLSRNPGDTVVMGRLQNLSAAISTGVVGTTQLVDSEAAFDFFNVKVHIERWRQGVRTDTGMNKQRNPYKSFEEVEIDLLSDWSAQIQDTSLFYAFFAGYAPHIFRVSGTGTFVPAAHPNILFGNDDASGRTVASLSPDDKFNGQTVRLLKKVLMKNNFDPVRIQGDDYWVLVINPDMEYTFLADSEVRNALQYGRERGIDNPLFKAADYVYSNCFIFVSQKLASVVAGKNLGSLTVSGGTITEPNYAPGGGLAASQIGQGMALCANAIALAEGEIRMAERKEDDYGNIIGRATDLIFGTRRLDWVDEAGANTSNQAGYVFINAI